MLRNWQNFAKKQKTKYFERGKRKEMTTYFFTFAFDFSSMSILTDQGWYNWIFIDTGFPLTGRHTGKFSPISETANGAELLRCCHCAGSLNLYPTDCQSFAVLWGGALRLSGLVVVTLYDGVLAGMRWGDGVWYHCVGTTTPLVESGWHSTR